jgi:DNA-binding MarR family transcriptional regulator
MPKRILAMENTTSGKVASQKLLMPELGPRRKLPRGAREMLKYLQSLKSWSARGFAFPLQKTLAERLGANRKTIKRWTEKLMEAGMLSRRRDPEDLRQWLYFPGEEDQSTSQIRGQNVPYSVPQLGDKMSHIFTLDEFSTLTAATGGAAVAKKEDQKKTEETVSHFSALDVKPDVIRPYVQKEPAQARVVLAILQNRRRPPDNPTGFAITAFEERWAGPGPPAEKRFDHDAFNARDREERERRAKELRDQPAPTLGGFGTWMK